MMDQHSFAKFIEQAERERLLEESEELTKDCAQLKRCADLIGELSWKTTNADAVALVTALQLLESGDDTRRSLEEIFTEVVQNANASYPINPSDADILTHVATPSIVRWVLLGIRRYAEKTNAKPQYMPSAFGLRRRRRGPRSGLTVHAKKLIEVGKAAYFDARAAGDIDAMGTAVEAALEAYIPLRMTDDEMTRAEARALRDQLWQILDKAIPTWK